MQTITLQSIFEEALEYFPYPDIERTGYTQGNIEDENEEEYAEEFTFQAGKLFDEDIIAGGWIDLRKDGEDISISALFNLSRNGDWENGRLLGECEGVQGWYDREIKRWTLQIDTY